MPTEAWKFEISQILRKMLSAIGLLLGHVALRPIPQLRIYIYWSILIIFQTIPNYLKNSFYNCLIILVNDSQYFSTFLIKKNSSLYHQFPQPTYLSTYPPPTHNNNCPLQVAIALHHYNRCTQYCGRPSHDELRQ